MTPRPGIAGRSGIAEHPGIAGRPGIPAGVPESAEFGGGVVPDRQFTTHVTRDFARRHLVVSEGVIDGVEQLVVPVTAADSTSLSAVIHNVSVRLRRAVATRVADGEWIAREIDRVFEQARRDASDNESALESDPTRNERASTSGGGGVEALLAAADRDLLNVEGKGMVVRLVDAILFEALGRDASDVHLQPIGDRCIVRYRIDGVLHEVRSLPPEIALAVTSRVKVMGRMDIAERRVPQDGRATVTISRRPIDLRISTVPTSHGERLVLRLLDHSRELHDFEGLGMPPEVSAPFLERARRAHGIILATGPTGSGKTTTLYATLKQVATPRLNVMTIEDPIEYELASSGLHVSQSQVNPRKGITFETGLRHVLRQDPDVVMVGEIRDAETARMAIQASQTGHLVLSTLHTNDAPSAVTRLVDLGVESFLVAATLSAVLAQRLLRLVHEPCSGVGCADCLGTGLRGRTGVFELLIVTEEVRALINEAAELPRLRAAAIHGGMRTLFDEGTRLVAEGRTTLPEVQRVLLGTL